MNVVSICLLNVPSTIRSKCGLSKEFEKRIYPYDTLETVERTRFHKKEETEQRDASAHLNKLIPNKENVFLFREG